MFPAQSLIATLLLALVVSAKPIVVRDNLIRLPFAKKINVTSAGQILRQDQARAAALRAHGLARANGQLTKDAVVSVPVENQAVSYAANVGVGSPATTCEIFIRI